MNPATDDTARSSTPSLPVRTLLALLVSSFGLAACGGGGGGAPAPEPIQVVIESSPERDGYVSSDPLNYPAAPDFTPTAGDSADADPVIFHALFSFDISSIPANAEIVSASLRLTSKTKTGGPAQMMQGMFVDHLRFLGTFPDSVNDIVNIQQAFAQWQNIDNLGERLFDATNRVKTDMLAGRTASQYRVRGANFTDDDNALDVISFNDGEDHFNTGDVPQLIITYMVP